MKQSPERKEKKKVHLVITGGILALICPPEYYKIYPEILKNDLKAVSTSFSVQNNTPHNSIRNLRGRIDSILSFTHALLTHAQLTGLHLSTFSLLLQCPFFQALQIFISGFCPVSVLSGKSGARLAERRCEEEQLPSATRDFQQKHQCV